jgi:hypothetical protein
VIAISVQDGIASVLEPDGKAVGIDDDLQTCGQTDDVVSVGQGVRLIEVVDTPIEAALSILPGFKAINMQIRYRENLRRVTQLSTDRQSQLSPPVERTPQELEWALFHLFVFRSKIGRDDRSTAAHPSLVTGGRAFDV